MAQGIPSTEELKESAQRHLSAGRLRLAEADYEAIESRVGNAERVVLWARAARFALRLNRIGPGATDRAELGKILLRSRDPTTITVAAAALSECLRSGCLQKAVILAERSHSAAPPELRGDAAHNLGELLFVIGRHRTACRYLEEAIDNSSRNPIHRALSSGLLAYGHSLRGDRRATRAAVSSALVHAASLDDSPYSTAHQLNIGFASAELDLPDEALQRADAALRTALTCELADRVHLQRAALMLKGDSLLRLGNRELAREAFSSLTATFVPGRSDVVELLLQGNSSRFLNWLA